MVNKMIKNFDSCEIIERDCVLVHLSQMNRPYNSNLTKIMKYQQRLCNMLNYLYAGKCSPLKLEKWSIITRFIIDEYGENFLIFEINLEINHLKPL